MDEIHGAGTNGLENGDSQDAGNPPTTPTVSPVSTSCNASVLSPSSSSAATLSPCSSSSEETETTSPPMRVTPEQQRASFGNRRLMAVKRHATNLMFTPLRASALLADATSLSLLLKGGSDVDAVNELGESALHFAAMRDRSGLCAYLLIDAGANVQCANVDGDTPLHYAAFANCEASVRALLAAGADRNARNREGYTPLSIATKPSVRTLLRSEPNTDVPFFR